MKISIVIPVFNEVETIKQVIDRVMDVDLGVGVGKEIVVVDDCSIDGTRDKLVEIGDRGVICLVMHEQNLGKGAALATGFGLASGDIVIVQDADLEYDPVEIPIVIKPILDNKADAVFASRFVGSQSHRVLYYWHYLGNRFLTFLSNVFTNLNLTDMEACYKAFRKDILDQLEIEEKRFGVEPEIVAKVAKLRCRIYEVGISYAGRTYEEGKKITWKDGLRAIWCILKYNMR